MKQALIFLLLSLCLFSCTKRSSFVQINHLEQMVLDDPLQAKVILDSLQNSEDTTDEVTVMHLRYLQFLLDDKMYLEHSHVSEIQDMMYFFEAKDDEKMLSRSYYAMGRIASDLHDYTQALTFFHKAIDLMKQKDDLQMKGRAYSQVGYVNVELNNVAAALLFQKKAYECDSLRNDSSAILYDLRDMAVTYDYLGDKSMACSCFLRAVKLIGEKNKFKVLQKELLLQLSDLYLYENVDSAGFYLKKALALDNTLSDGAAFVAANYFYSVNADDSAKHYLTKVLINKSYHVKADAAKFLVKIAIDNENIAEIEKYFNDYLQFADSLQKKEKANDIQQGKALFEYVYQTERAQRLEDSNRWKMYFLGLGIVIIVVLILLLIMSWQMSLVRRLKIQNKLSYWKLKSVEKTGDNEKYNRLICEQTEIHEAIINKKHISNDGWEQIAAVFDSYYPEFKERLNSITSLSDYENQICLLVKIGIGTSKIAYLISRAPSTVSTAKQRIFKKITKMKGSAEQFDELISNI